jgi:molybdenum cofactor biosynthesis enzyme MoaA
LSRIAEAASIAFGHCELTTNGLLLTNTRWNLLKDHVSRIKVSLDTLEPIAFRAITGVVDTHGVEKVLAAINMVKNDGKDVVINCVVTRKTLPGIWTLLDWAMENNIRVHLLDYYYSEERRNDWAENFVFVDTLLGELSARYGIPFQENRFGCEFFVFTNLAGSIIRVKRSTAATMRAEKCKKCGIYCQEGLYGLKLSLQGWLTTCPSQRQEDGILCDPQWGENVLAERVKHFFEDLNDAEPDSSAFYTFLSKRNLAPICAKSSALD